MVLSVPFAAPGSNPKQTTYTFSIYNIVYIETVIVVETRKVLKRRKRLGLDHIKQ